MAHRMENYPCSSSSAGDSSSPPPRAGEIDAVNNHPGCGDDDPLLPPNPPPFNNDPNQNHHHSCRVKFMCSYGGKIQPRTHDNQLSYVGGHTKILAVDRSSIHYSALLARLASLRTPSTGAPAEAVVAPNNVVCFKYQLPGEDLDALISVTNDEDLEHMMLEYDTLCRYTAKPARLRLFIFSLGQPPPPTSLAGSIVDGFAASLSGRKSSSDRQWFVDALDSAAAAAAAIHPAPPFDSASHININIPDFLFGLEKGSVFPPALVMPIKDPDPLTENKVMEASPVDDVTMVSSAAASSWTAGSDATNDDKYWTAERGGGEPITAQYSAEIQSQIQELQRLRIAGDQDQQIAGEEQPAPATAFQQLQQKASNKEAVSRGYAGDNNKAPPPSPAPVQILHYQERQMTDGVYVGSMARLMDHHPIYLIPAAGPQQGAYPLQYPVSSQHASQGYYPSQRCMVATGAAVFGDGVGTPPKLPSKLVSGGTTTSYLQLEGCGNMVQPLAQGVVEEAVRGFPGPHLLAAGYDGVGRPIYYTAAVGGGGGLVPTMSQTVMSTAAAAAAVQQPPPPATTGAATAVP